MSSGLWGCIAVEREFACWSNCFGAGFVETRLDDVALLVACVKCFLELLLHGWVVGLETGRDACEADVLYGRELASPRLLTCELASEVAGAIGGQSTGSVSSGGVRSRGRVGQV